MVFEDEAGEEYEFDGSGYVVGASTIVTCAHCVYDLENDLGWVKAIRIEPGVQEDQQNFPVYTTEQIRYIEVDEDWSKTGSEESDSAIIVLNENIARYTGMLKLSSRINAQQTVRLAGYPRKYPGRRAGFLQVESKGEGVIKNGRCIETNLYATGGESGAPILNENNEVIGTYAYSYSDQLRAGGPAMDGERIARISSYSATGDAAHSESACCHTFNELESPVYRVYNASTGEHFYTMNEDERDTLVGLGWIAEGIAWTSCTDANPRPVYRVYNPNTGDHHYTVDKDEYDSLGRLGWQKEGVCWMAAQKSHKQAEPVYRVYNPNAKLGSHHFTEDKDEVQALVDRGWKYEHVGFYVDD